MSQVRNRGVLLLRALKGAPLAVLVAIRCLGRGGPGDLAAVTGYDRGTVGQALRALAALGFVEAFGRVSGWRATTAAAQLPLFIPSELAGGELTESEGENFPLAGGSSSSSLTMDQGREDKQLLLLPGRDGEKFPLPLCPAAAPVSAAELRIETALIEQGCPRVRARQVTVTALRERGYFPAYVEMEILRWAAYIQRYGKTINNPGAFLAAKITRGEHCPDVRLWDNPWCEMAQQVDRLAQEWARQEAAADGAADADLIEH